VAVRSHRDVADTRSGMVICTSTMPRLAWAMLGSRPPLRSYWAIVGPDAA